MTYYQIMAGPVGSEWTSPKSKIRSKSRAFKIYDEMIEMYGPYGACLLEYTKMNGEYSLTKVVEA